MIPLFAGFLPLPFLPLTTGVYAGQRDPMILRHGVTTK